MKLVRDKVPDRMAADDCCCVTRECHDTEEFRIVLLDKLVEDANFDIKPMPEPLKSMFLDAVRETGDMNRAIDRIEERLNSPQYVKLCNFVKWLKQWELTVGHGTIDLRWTEHTNRLRPMSKDQAYDFAMAAMAG